MSSIAGIVVPPPIERQQCYLCGARRRRDEVDEAWVADRQVTYQQSEMRRMAGPDGEERWEVDERPWSRRHVACEPTASGIVAAVTGVRLADELAQRVLREHGVNLLARERQASSRAPWSHLTRREVEAVTALAAAAAAPQEPFTHPSGRCGMCGCSRSLSWASSRASLPWPDGTQAALCATCTAIADHARDPDLLRTRALADLAGARPSPMLKAHQHYGYRHACEAVPAEQRHDEDADRWTYRPAALQRIRAAVASALPELLLDPEARERGIELLQKRRALQAAEEAGRHAGTTLGAGDDDWA